MQFNDVQNSYNQSTKLDMAGFIASFICAIHCAFMPLLLASLPMLGLSFFSSHWFDVVMIVLSLGIASISLIKGYNQFHRKPFALLVMLAGFGFIAYAELSHTNYHYLLAAIGALLVAASHVFNHFLCRQAIFNRA